MKHRMYCILFALLISTAASGQTGTIKGTLSDSASKKNISGVTVTLLLQKDSSLVSFSMTDNNGRFELSHLNNGKYRLLFTHASFHSINRYLSITDSSKSHDLGIIPLTDHSTTLQEVVISNEAPPVTLVGDTIQYNASSFKTRPNASVEDLLKKLPGVKVEKDGTVKAQGEKVQKVLVDGKEFFGNDPRMATKNLPAEAVDKVQVYDKLSDQAEMTGFDDGNSEKTINLTLKKDKKKGLFGKVEAGAGTGNRYEGRFNVNAFRGARQVSVIGMANNSNAEGFSFMDILNFSGALNRLKGMGGNGEINLSISQDDPVAGLIGGNNTGINTIFGTGFNYNNIIGSKTDFRSNYFFSRYNPYRETQLQRQYFTPQNLYQQQGSSDNLATTHRVNINTDILADTFNSVKINLSAGSQRNSNHSSSGYSTRSGNQLLINDGSSTNQSVSNGNNFDAGILYRRKFLRRGRTFSVNLQSSFNNSKGNGALHAVTEFFDTNGALLTSDSINQENANTASLRGYTAKMLYTEPVFKRALLEFSVGSAANKNTAEKSTFDYNATSGKFDLPNAALTNDYSSTYNSRYVAVRFRKIKRKYNFSAGASYQHSGLEGNSANGNAYLPFIKKQFSVLLPEARFQYQFNRDKNITLRYNTFTNQPSITQLQPVPDNSNPLYVRLGNPALDQEYTHQLKLNASFVNPFKNRNLFAFVDFRATQHKIVNSNYVNELGIDSVMPVNTNGVYNINSAISFSYPVRFLKATMEISAGTAFNNTRQFSQHEANNIRQLVLSPAARLDMTPTDHLSLSLAANLDLIKTSYSLQPSAGNHYLNQEYSAVIDLELSHGFFFSSDFNYRITNQQAAGYNQQVPLWNMSLSKQLLHFNRCEIKLSVYDLLDKNLAVSRNANLNYIEDTRTNNLRRYFLLSFAYNLNKTVLGKARRDGIQVIRR